LGIGPSEENLILLQAGNTRFIRFNHLMSLVIEIGNQHRAMMFWDKGFESLWQPVLLSHDQSFTNMLFNNFSTLPRVINLIVLIGTTHLIFNEG